ncbi:tail fiber assembly protein [Xenorhabdus bovienii]|uniref:tail fiber assembly protein n=1 Tax=Xenorhabdus bovienii TaxID=40576 RepID=UPI00237C998A|nr:tail fiber assembly protein [Xenorhabdus bovienii]MDE1494907.1 tail fiber assembly protein [Xenorhabdus bovienii]
MYVYSAKNNAFCPIELKQRYVDAGSWPDDGIEVSQNVYNEFRNPPEGKMCVAGPDGLPAWADIPPPTSEELQRRAEQEKQYRMTLASNAIAPLQDAVDLGMSTDAEKSALTEWRRYRVLLNRVDCTTAPDVKWPEQPK